MQSNVINKDARERRGCKYCKYKIEKTGCKYAKCPYSYILDKYKNYSDYLDSDDCTLGNYSIYDDY